MSLVIIIAPALKAVVDEDIRKFDWRHAVQSDVGFFEQVLVRPAWKGICFEKFAVLVHERKGRGDDLGFGKLPMRLQASFRFYPDASDRPDRTGK